MTTAEVLKKKGQDFAIRLFQKLQTVMPSKGSITSTNLGEMKASSRGLKVRDSIVRKVMEKAGAATRLDNHAKPSKVGGLNSVGFRFRAALNKTGDKLANSGGKSEQKGMNLRALMVKRELAARESGRGYLAFAALMKVKKLIGITTLTHRGRVGQSVGTLTLANGEDQGSLTFNWGGMGRDGNLIQSGVGLAKPRQQRLISEALNEMRADMAAYLARKHAEALQNSVNKAVRAARMVRA